MVEADRSECESGGLKFYFVGLVLIFGVSARDKAHLKALEIDFCHQLGRGGPL